MSRKKVIVVGATGMIGKAVVAVFKGNYDVVEASRGSAHKVDISDPDSIRTLLKSVGKVDGIINTAGSARFKPLAELSDEDFAFSLRNKLMGQVNLARIGLEHVNDGGMIILTTGFLAQNPSTSCGAISLVNSGVEGFVRAAALEMPRGLRINAVSPPWVTETLVALKMDTRQGKPAAEVARAYMRTFESTDSGKVVPV
jgi:NAD(P)-dependent dehydrogenase (short-subunit alcohol dehydrogenase family)